MRSVGNDQPALNAFPIGRDGFVQRYSRLNQALNLDEALHRRSIILTMWKSNDSTFPPTMARRRPVGRQGFLRRFVSGKGLAASEAALRSKPTERTKMPFTLLHLSALVFFPTFMALSASMDLLTFTIPNRLCAGLALGYLVFAILLGAPLVGILLNISCALVVLTIAFVMFSLGWIGGGDAKLAAATAAWLGWTAILDYGLAAALFGGGLTLLILAGRKAPMPAAFGGVDWLARLHNAKSGVPYGIALAAAGLMQYPNSTLWTAGA